MKSVLLIGEIIISVVLIILIQLQTSKGGLGQAFGGEFYRTKRGAERIVFGSTILFAVLFLIFSIVSLVIR